jgi:hypothetical protein
MKRFVMVLLIGTAISCFVGGRVYFGQSGNRVIGDPEFGAFIAFIGFLITCVVASISLKVINPGQYRLLWIACCVLYPLAIYVGFSSAASATQNAATIDPNTRALLIKNYELDNDREPNQQELADYAKMIMAQSGMNGSAEMQGVLRQVFWGPVFVSIYFYGLMVIKKRKQQVAEPVE